MEQSCSKTIIPTARPAIRSSVPQFPYANFSQPIGVSTEGPSYRRNDPSNRVYRMKKRNPAQVYHCVQCNKHIKYPSKISEHIRKHTGEKPHVCLVCHQTFSQSHTLKAHMQSHMHEKPFKCSFCNAVFMDVGDKEEHEAQHMQHEDHPESMEDNCVPYIHVEPVAAEHEQLEDEQLCRIFECPFGCGFQSLEEAVVEAHIADHQRLDHFSWDVQQDQEEPVAHTSSETVHTNGIIVGEYNAETDQMYEFFDEQFVPEVATEAIVEPTEETEQQACTSNTVPYFEEEEVEVQTSGEGVEKFSVDPKFDEIIYEEETTGGIETHLSQYPKKMILPRGNRVKQVIPEHIYSEMIIHEDLEEAVEDVGILQEEEEEQERVRVIVNPNPPKRGTKSTRDHHEASAAMTEMVVDAATLELAAPTRHLKQGYPAMIRRRKGKKAHNLDWIIDAVAKGVDVSDASPHHRKKPTVHKCEICGKVDKYPSKISAHMRTHTGEKPFKCDICGMAFSQRTPMRLHLRRHFDQKPYECDVDGCKERFVSGAILKSHVEKKHLNKKKYVCIRGCGRVFSSAFNQRHHEKKCQQNTYMTWVQENESEEDQEGEYLEEDEEYMDEMMDPSSSDPIPPDSQFAEVEPVFLHQ